MNTQILYTVLFVTDNRYFKYIYILCFIKLISWKRFTNCFDLDIWYFLNFDLKKHTHIHVSVFLTVALTVIPIVCVYTWIIMAPLCEFLLVLGVITNWSYHWQQCKITRTLSHLPLLDMIASEIYFTSKTPDPIHFYNCNFHEKFTRVRITRNLYQNQSKESVKSNKILQCKKWPCLISTSFLWGTCQNAACRYFLHFFF